jgi:nucleoside-diphosphate-sugar epimerase
MEKVLITGANGLLGFELIQKLPKDFEVFKLVKTYNKDLGDNQIVHNLLDEIDLSRLPKQLDYIFHLAQFRDFKNFPQNSSEIFKVNTLSTLSLINYGMNCGIKKFIYTSTGGLYKEIDSPINEDNLMKKHTELDFYCASKLSSELLISSYSKFIDVQILRPFFIFGPRQSDQMLIPRLIKNIYMKDIIYLSGEKGIHINPIYVEDAASILIKLLRIPGSKQINVAGNQVISISQLSTNIAEIIGKEPNFSYQSKQKDLIGDNSLLKEIIGEISWTELKESLKETIIKKLASNA